MSNNGKRKKQTIDIQHNSTEKSGNVLDLRSIAAKKQVEKAQRERKIKEIAAKKAIQEQKKRSTKRTKKNGEPVVQSTTKKRSSQKKKSKKAKADAYGDELLMRMEQTATTQAPSKQEFDFWHQEDADGTVLFANIRELHSQRKVEKKAIRKRRQQARERHREAVLEARKIQKHGSRTQVKAAKATRSQSSNHSRWSRPLTDSAIERAQKKADKKTLPEYGFSFAAIGKPLIGFALVSLVFVLPASVSAVLNRGGGLESAVVQSTEEAFSHLQQAGADLQGLNFAGAEEQFESAGFAFDKANEEIEHLSGVVASAAKYVPGKGKTFYTGVHLLAAGDELAEAGELLSGALAELDAVDLKAVAQDEDAGLTSVLLVVHAALAPASEHIQTAAEHMELVDPQAVPAEYRNMVIQAQDMMPLIASTVEESVGTTELLLSFLGHDEQKRYLVLFQNNHELRPTGGFIGSLALIDINNGVVTGLEVPGGGVYDIAGQQREQVVSPAPMHVVNPHWNIQDANWFPHFPSSALKVQDFFESAQQPSVDGVITLVPSVIEDLIGATEPIDLTEDFDVIITEDNFYDEVQVRAEEKFDVTRESKRIIGELTPLLFQNLFSAAENPEQLVDIASVVRDAMIRKEVLVYMNDDQLQQLFSERDWSGELKETDRDYLAVFHANIGGGKTSQVIDEVVKHEADIQEDGSIINTVTLTRVHKGDPESVLEGEVNTDYVRFYVPQGSTLLDTSGFESPDPALFMKPISTYGTDNDLEQIQGEVLLNTANGISTNQEYGKTVFGGWTRTAPNESSTVTIQYELPFSLDTQSFWNATDRYSLLVQRQPGYDVFFTSDIRIPDTMEPVRSFPADFTGATQLLLTEDYFAGILLTRR